MMCSYDIMVRLVIFVFHFRADSETCLNIQQSGSATLCHRRPIPSDADGNNKRHDDFGAFPPNSVPPSKRFRRSEFLPCQYLFLL